MSDNLLREISAIMQSGQMAFFSEAANIPQMMADIDSAPVLARKIVNYLEQGGGDATNSEGNVKELTRKLEMNRTWLDAQTKSLKLKFPKEDQIVWAVKYLKSGFLAIAMRDAIGGMSGGYTIEKNERVVKALGFILQYGFSRKMQKAMGEDSYRNTIRLLFWHSGTERLTDEINSLSKFAKAGVVAVDAITFDPSLSYGMLHNALENAYNATWKGWIKLEGENDVKVLKEYPDKKMAWVSTDKAYCSAEQEAMGHCGNEPRQNSDDILISLSTMKTDATGNRWRMPHVTVIKEDGGIIGEIKGRGNKKPVAEKYGKYLVDLMLLRGIRGMGDPRWVVEENWTWEDFTEDQQQEIMAGKPDFDFQTNGAPIVDRWIAGGDSDVADEFETWLRTEVYLNNNSIESVNRDFIVMETTLDCQDLMSEVSDDIQNMLNDIVVRSEKKHGSNPSHDDIMRLGEMLEIPANESGPLDFEADIFPFYHEHFSVKHASETIVGQALRKNDAKLNAALAKKFPTVMGRQEFEFIDDEEAKSHIIEQIVKRTKFRVPDWVFEERFRAAYHEYVGLAVGSIGGHFSSFFEEEYPTQSSYIKFEAHRGNIRDAIDDYDGGDDNPRPLSDTLGDILDWVPSNSGFDTYHMGSATFEQTAEIEALATFLFQGEAGTHVTNRDAVELVYHAVTGKVHSAALESFKQYSQKIKSL